MPAHRVLQLANKGKTGIGSQISIYQLDRYGPQLIGIFGIRSGKATTRGSPNFRNHKFQRIATVAGFILSGQRRRCALHFTHHRQRIVPRCALSHRKITSD